MTTTTEKIWCPENEQEPEGLFNKASCPNVPPNWFRESPEFAAELYAMERCSPEDMIAHKPTLCRVHVLDTEHVLHKFDVRIVYEMTAHVKQVKQI